MKGLSKMWWIIGGIVVAGFVAVTVWYCDQHGQGKRGVPGRHEDTGEFPTIQVETPEGYGEFRTAVLPVQGDVLTDTGTLIARNDTRALPVRSVVVSLPEPIRTDTVMMEAVDPTKYPDWVKEELDKL